MSKPVSANAVVTRPRKAILAALPDLFSHHFSVDDDALRIDLPPHAVAELAATPVDGKHTSPTQARWYPKFAGTISLVELHGQDATDVRITGTLEHGTAPFSDVHYERDAAQRALEHLLHLIQHHFQHAKRPVRTAEERPSDSFT